MRTKKHEIIGSFLPSGILAFPIYAQITRSHHTSPTKWVSIYIGILLWEISITISNR